MTSASHVRAREHGSHEAPYALVSYDEVETLRKRIGLDRRVMARYLGVSDRTYGRRRHEGILNRGESLKAEMLGLVYDDATRAFADDTTARAWLREPILALEERSPIEHLTSVRGYREVRDVLLQLQHGIF